MCFRFDDVAQVAGIHAALTARRDRARTQLRAFRWTERRHVFRWKQPSPAPNRHLSWLLEMAELLPVGRVIRKAKQKIREYIAHRELRKPQVPAMRKDGAREVPALVKLNYADVPGFLHSATAQLVRSQLKKLLNEGRVADHDGVSGIK